MGNCKRLGWVGSAIREAANHTTPVGTAAASHTTLPVLAVTGLAREARLAAGPGITTIWAGGDAARLRAMLSARMQPNCRAVVSIGIAGGLDPTLVPGDVIVATGVAAPDRRYEVSLDLAHRLTARLSRHPKLVVLASLAGVDTAVTSPEAKSALRDATGALAVDMNPMWRRNLRPLTVCRSRRSGWSAIRPVGHSRMWLRTLYARMARSVCSACWAASFGGRCNSPR